MTKVKKLFYGSDDTSQTNVHSIEVFNSIKNEIFIEISVNGEEHSFISLDKETAREFLKELRTSFENLD